MTIAVSLAAAAAVTHINILNCHSCLVWSMDKPAEPMAGSCMNGPRRAGGQHSEMRRARDAAGLSSELWQISSRAVSSKIIMTWQIINKHSRVISKAKLMNSFQVFYSRPKKIFYCILICIELATGLSTNNNTKWIRFINIFLETLIFLPVLVLLGRIRQRFNHYFNLQFWWVMFTSLFCVGVF